jgi:hypothetical protein
VHDGGDAHRLLDRFLRDAAVLQRSRAHARGRAYRSAISTLVGDAAAMGIAQQERAGFRDPGN